METANFLPKTQSLPLPARLHLPVSFVHKCDCAPNFWLMLREWNCYLHFKTNYLESEQASSLLETLKTVENTALRDSRITK